MAGVDFEGMTESQLRLELAQYGYQITPLTDTNKATLIRRLKYVTQMRKSPYNSAGRFNRMSRYSSDDEDSDSDKKKKKNKPAYEVDFSGYMQPPTYLKIKKLATLTPESQQIPLGTRTNPSATPLLGASENVFRLPGHLMRTDVTTPNVVMQSSVSESSLGNSMTSSERRSFLKNEPAQPCLFRKRTVTNVEALRRTKARSELTQLTPQDSRGNTDTVDKDSGTSVKRSHPVQSRFVPRVPGVEPLDRAASSTHVSTKVKTTLDALVAPGEEQVFRNENGLLIRNRRTGITKQLDLAQQFKTTEDKKWFSVHYQKVSMILVTIVLLFFMGLGLIYVNVHFKDTDQFGPEGNDNMYPICDLKDGRQNACIEENHLKHTIEMLKILSPKLMNLAVHACCNANAYCGPLKSTMTEAEVVVFLLKTVNDIRPLQAKFCARYMKILVIANPHWIIKVSDRHCVERDYLYIHDTRLRLLECGIFGVRYPILPLSCQIKLLFSSYSTWSYILAGIALSGLLFASWRYKQYKDVHMQDVYMLVNMIISMLRNRHGQSPEPVEMKYLSVDRCRDDILMAINRPGLIAAWLDAVTFIEKHESRVYMVTRDVGGKPFKMWRWITLPFPHSSSFRYRSITEPSECVTSFNATVLYNPNQEETLAEPPSRIAAFTPTVHSSPKEQQSRRTKVWQGQAFDTIAGSPNSLPCSPTPCLKIRHMFEPFLETGEDWHILIQDAVLEKCENVKILHIFVDRTSNEGLVFMKCSSEEEAGKAYRALHGWWFDRKLITVKYLRSERYHERFPGATRAMRQLRPTNNKRLSLQELWQFPVDTS